MSGSSDYTQTPKLLLFKPTFNADVSNWGQHWNQNADTLDSAVTPLTATRISMPNLPKSTGTPADLAAKGIVSGDLYNNGGVVCVAP
jgi:hypothetical protein